VVGVSSWCAFSFDAVAVKLWFRGARKASAFIGFIAGLAFVVTFSNSLGGIVSRADVVQAQRHYALTSQEDRRRELKRIEKALDDLGHFVPTDEEAVKAARRAADAAAISRQAECGTTEKQRGNNCRARESDERVANENLAKATAAKATTDMARRYESQIAALKTMEVPNGEVVGHANPLGRALANMIGSTADTITSWQQAVI